MVRLNFELINKAASECLDASDASAVAVRYKLMHHELSNYVYLEGAAPSENFFGKRWHASLFAGWVGIGSGLFVFRRFTRGPGEGTFRLATVHDWVLVSWSHYGGCHVQLATGGDLQRHVDRLKRLPAQAKAVESVDANELNTGWVTVKTSRGAAANIQIVLHEHPSERAAAEAAAAAAKAVAEAAAASAKAEAEAAAEARLRALKERFSPPLSQDLKMAGFDPGRLNIAIVGTQNAGKSTFANLLLTGCPDGPTEFADAARTYLSSIKVDDEEVKAVVARVGDLPSYKTGTGLCTTRAMFKSKECQKDVDVWFPKATLWDVPGLEAGQGGVIGYCKDYSLNYFDAVVIIAEKQFSEDDFAIMCFLQNAMVDGITVGDGGVPFYIVRTKADDVPVDDFEQFCKQGGVPRKWMLKWAENSKRIRNQMLGGLDDANRALGQEDPTLTMSEQVAFAAERFYFSGFPQRLEQSKWKGAPTPLKESHKLCSIFQRDLRLLRQDLYNLACRKGSDAACRFQWLMAAMECLGSPLKKPDSCLEVECTINTAKLGFRVTDSEIKKPKKGGPDPDLREEHGIESDDELLEFPVGEPFEEGMDVAKLEKAIERPFQILVKRQVAAGERTLQGSNFVNKWVTDSTITLQEYDRAVAALIRGRAISEGFPANEVEHQVDSMMTALKKGRPTDSDPPLADIAGYDWTSAEQLMFDGTRYGELCSMVAKAVREDTEPAVGYAVTFLLALHPRIVDRDSLSKRTWPDGHKTFRGTTMPEDVLKGFFTVGKKYRASMPVATSAKEDVATWFMNMSHNANMSRAQVLFEVDVSEEPYHVSHIEYSLKGEHEYLFMPYSTFEVVRVQPGAGYTRVHIRAFADNKPLGPGTEGSEAWMLSTWH